MTEKEKIRAEIIRRMKGKCPIVCSYIIYEDILNFIDSMQEEPTIPDIVDEHYWEMLGEEPVSEDLEEAAKNYMRSQNPPIWGLYHGFKAGAQWQKQQMTKEPISEDWEKAAKHYLYSNILYDDVYMGNPTDKDCIEMFKAGAKWQKQKDEKALNENTLLYNARLEGVEIGKAEMMQQMMKEAVDGLVVCDELTHGYKDIAMHIPDSLEVGDKVKLIIIKEDEQ